ncbi:MAG: hypothetical protein JSV63_04410 [Candidatus Aenigmatarchaeota archaeon]|nr:MAG: hypothetical protein JSV63_04410 [Candidatus Aenigmarchaeota archaeon]
MLCGLRTCPLLSRFNVRPKIQKNLKEDFFGPSTSVFIGRFGYPDVFTGPLAPMTTDHTDIIDKPSTWFGTPYQDLVEMRSTILRTKEPTNIFARNRTVDQLQEIALAKKAPDVEMTLKGKPVYRVSFSDVSQPMGPSANLKTLDIAGNVRISRHVDKAVSDELTARESGYMLYSKGEDVYKVSTILSSGSLGMPERRKLVPTRWSITASQTLVANEIIKEIKDYPSVNDYMVFTSEYLDNHYEVLLMPGAWEFENFEAWAPGTPWSMNAKNTEVLAEYEPYRGRTKYADLQGGGFYASRLAVTEGLKALRRQARVVVFREVHEGYVIPLGVWQVLENVRNAFRSGGSKFVTKEEALKDIETRLRLPLTDYERQSVILRRKTLADFIAPAS